ncbi:unnamed protein product [Cylicocyclus nassatus]|uniref:VWFA domain-containing protein n=1 Tax=Cylicocyclus nassatus TaxID=53992 RepID=A0AA36GER3_CYLNA|nr:unnamed protein product [Cylicocyclus nassatus]
MTFNYLQKLNLILYLLYSEVTADSHTFSNLCLRPSNNGRGKLESSSRCTVIYPVKTETASDAEDYCYRSLPYAVSHIEHGDTTKCVYERGFFCEDNEEEIFDKCFITHSELGEYFGYNYCPKRYLLHNATSLEELKWISLVFKKEELAWIGNSGENAKFLKPKITPNLARRKLGKKSGPLFVRLIVGARDGTIRGRAYYGTIMMQMPYICSRKADAYEETHVEDHELMSMLGFRSKAGASKSGHKRAFVMFGHKHAVEATQFEANFKKLHQGCYALLHGFVASRLDFIDQREYEKVLMEGNGMLIRAPLGRNRAFTLKNSGKCVKERFFEKHRKKWNYVNNKGKSFEVPSAEWRSSYPDNMCADLPRITAAMHESGYMDIPAFARRPIICMSGAEPHKRNLKRGESCNRAARYNKKKKRCECIQPDSDGTIVNPEKYGHYPPGFICLSCSESKEKRSIVFILDRSGTVREEGWAKQLEVMAQVANNIKGSKTGIVMVVDEPYVALELGVWKKKDYRLFIGTERQFLAEWTVVGRAMYLAREILKEEKGRRKFMIILSDGDPDQCHEGEGHFDCTAIWEHMRNHNQFDEAEKARKEGITILYSPVGPDIDPTSNSYQPGNMLNIERIAGQKKNIIKDFNKGLLEDAVKVLCEEIV